MTAANGPTANLPVASPPAATLPTAAPDFHRPLVSLLGLPFDALTMSDAVERIRAAAFGNRRCFVSTPNLNFAITARGDAAFRGSVLRSDLSLVDGMPLVWIARLLGLPVPGRVAGADVFEALQAHPGAPLSVYLFGGPPGAAAQAGERINARGGGVRCVGFDGAGFGGVEAMSSPELIARINASGAQFLVVALGARKGQAWIEHNAARLAVPVLSHLGAVVNFAAGSVRRAPAWVRRGGLEWLWRIKEEPALWRRYASDATRVLALLATRVLPDALLLRSRPDPRATPSRVEVLTANGATTLAVSGPWRGRETGTLGDALMRCAALDHRVVVDLAGTTEAGDALVALLLVADGWFAARSGFSVTGARAAVADVFARKLAAELLTDRAAR